MAYAGYLIKVGGADGTVFPMKYIRVETYKCTPNQRIDQGSDSDATGTLHRTVLPHTRTKIEFETPQMLRGAAALALESGQPFGAMKDAVCSPGGTTIAGVRALEEGGLRAAAMNAVIAAYEKTLALKQ